MLTVTTLDGGNYVKAVVVCVLSSGQYSKSILVLSIENFRKENLSA